MSQEKYIGMDVHQATISVTLVAEDGDYLVLNVDREAAKHGASRGRQRRDRVEHELMRDGLSLLDGEGNVLQREGGFIATGLRH